MKTFKKPTPANQEGFASLVIAIVLVLILSLITVGFAQLMREEQRGALDRQLSSQAYYAAESGINMAEAAINKGYDGYKRSCDNEDISKGSLAAIPAELTDAQKTVGKTTGSSFPCLLINPTPATLEYSPISTTESKLVQVRALKDGAPAAVDTISFSWQAADNSRVFAGPGNCNKGAVDTFPPATANSGNTWANSEGKAFTGLLRVQVIPINDLSRNGLNDNSSTAFLCPNAGNGTPGSLSYGSNIGANSGGLINGNCNVATSSDSPRYCTANITGLASTINQTTFFLSMRSIYSANTVTVRLFDAEGNRLNIAGAQTLIDSTGKAHDVLRRIQVRVPSVNTYDVPDGTQATEALCKQLEVLAAPDATRSDNSRCSLP